MKNFLVKTVSRILFAEFENMLLLASCAVASQIEGQICATVCFVAGCQYGSDVMIAFLTTSIIRGNLTISNNI